jgi:hypothetical protein
VQAAREIKDPSLFRRNSLREMKSEQVVRDETGACATAERIASRGAMMPVVFTLPREEMCAEPANMHFVPNEAMPCDGRCTTAAQHVAKRRKRHETSRVISAGKTWW